jgi:hypothetical protein
MSLANLIRGKRTHDNIATATPATFATQETERERTVASVATVAVANSREVMPEAMSLPAAETYTPTIRQPLAPMTQREESAILEWLALIDEADPGIISEVIARCKRDLDARNYFTGRLAANLIRRAAGDVDDDRSFSSSLLVRK